MQKISIVVPCYNEQASIPYFYHAIRRIADEMSMIQLELIFVDDGSKDDTLEVIKQLYEEDNRIHYLSFSRNFGKESAIYAGMKAASGDYVAVMDVDMQDPPSLLPQMYQILTKEKAYDCVATRRTTRKGEPPIRSFFARQFYKLINKISKTQVIDGARDFRMMTRRMVDSILSMEEYNRFSKGIFGWVGFQTKWLEYVNVKRVAGETKWSFWKLLVYALDGITAFSTAPLILSSIFGLFFCAVALIMIVVIVVKTLIWGDPVAGYPSLICAIFLLGGVQLLCLGILGQYLSKTYLETKHRPIYIIKEKK